MKRDDLYTFDELTKLGWDFVDLFGSIQIWKKDEDYILWNADTHVVEFYREA